MPFGSYEFKCFAQEWNFEVTTSSPHYPKSNVLAEKGVGIAKNLLKKCKDLNFGLLEYRNTPVIGVGLSPAQILMNRELKSKIPISNDALKPVVTDHRVLNERIENKRYRDKKYYDKNSKERQDFIKGENIVIREGKQWVRGKIDKILINQGLILYKTKEVLNTGGTVFSLENH